MLGIEKGGNPVSFKKMTIKGVNFKKHRKKTLESIKIYERTVKFEKIC